MKDTWMEKGLVISVILLFIVVAVAPTINFTAVRASDDNDTVEVTTQACGIQGYGTNTVRLTREQYQDLEQYIVDFRARLNKTTTREEAVPIFKEAVVELDKYGLLPKGMSVEQVQRLVTRDSQNKRLIQLINNMYSKNLLSLGGSNYCCLLVGNTDFATSFQGPISNSLGYLLAFLLIFNPPPLYDDNLVALALAMMLLNYLTEFIPFTPMSCIAFGYPDVPGLYHGRPATGWINSIGLGGSQNWNGSFYGGLIPIPIFISGYNTAYLGCRGFTGIKIGLEFLSWFYFGSALVISVY
jgi:hypothetical protein